MRKQIIIIFLINLFNYYYLTAQEILWWYDVNDSAFGQSCSEDINNDGFLDVVFGCYRNDSSIYALSGKDGKLLWKYNTSFGGAEGCNDVAPLIYDVDGDGDKDVIVPSSCNPTTFCFNGVDGSVKWKAATRGSDSPPTIGDIDGDGNLEILHGEFLGYVICLDAKTGKRKWEILVQPNTWIQTAPSLVDIDKDGLLDFVVSTWCLAKTDTNRIYAFRGYDQKLLWKKDLGGTVYHGTSIADLDGNGSFELIFGDYSAKLYVLNAENGKTLWTFSDNNFYYIGSPSSIGDLDGDGTCEIVFSTAYEVIALKHDGRALWRFQLVSDFPSFRGVALSDIDNDNLPDVVFGTNQGKIIVLKGTNGENISTIDLQKHFGKEFSIEHCPLVADFNLDGKLDIFVVGGKTDYPDFSKNYGRAYLISFGKGKGPEWKMFQNNIYRNGSICNKIEYVFESEAPQSKFSAKYNKSNDLVEVKLNFENSAPCKIYFLDFFGRKCEEFKKSSAQSDIFYLDVRNFPSGVYIIFSLIQNSFETKLVSLIK
ncbi:MAG: FG-GAP-like repeat-containing protein [Ignavibacteria bacterium]|nr:FG-GAP-like repeat-containing protein [Ignavibacteria bacterium]